MVRRDLAGHLEPALLGRADQQDLLAERDVRQVHGPVVERGHQDHRGQRAALGVGDDGRTLGPGREMLHPERHLVQAQRAVGLVEIHLQAGDAWASAGAVSTLSGPAPRYWP